MFHEYKLTIPNAHVTKRSESTIARARNKNADAFWLRIFPKNAERNPISSETMGGYNSIHQIWYH